MRTGLGFRLGNFFGIPGSITPRPVPLGSMSFEPTLDAPGGFWSARSIGGCSGRVLEIRYDSKKTRTARCSGRCVAARKYSDSHQLIAISLERALSGNWQSIRGTEATSTSNTVYSK